MQARAIRILIELFIAIFFSFSCLTAQVEIEPALYAPLTPESLIKEVFAGKGVDITDVTFIGESKAIGFFKNGSSDVGIKDGFLMTTGEAFLGSQSNTNSKAGHPHGLGKDNVEDAILDQIVNDGGTFDEAIYEIEFIPKYDTIEFKYVFASEEYPEFGCNCFNDVFGFFLNGPGYADWTNLAVVPGTLNDPVSVKTIHPLDPDGPGNGDNSCTSTSTLPDCNPLNEHLFRDNTGSMTLTYDGLTTVLTAKAFVQKCETYTIKLALADVGDDLYDSAVFFEANSFGSAALQVDLVTESIDGALIEGCAGGSITFSFDEPVEENYKLNLNLLGNALKGTDYDLAPLSDVIIAGTNALTLNIRALIDEIVEPLDSIGFEIALNDCETETYWLYIKDSELEDLDLGEDQSVCPGDSVSIDGALGIPIPQELSFTSTNNNLDINTLDDDGTGPNTESTVSIISVSGIQPTDLRIGLIKEVCVKISHSKMEDIDLLLESPSGDILELSTDNGGTGNDFTNTCFTPDAMTSIVNGVAPFDGNFLPEGNWTELNGGNANGDWKLYVKDDFRNIVGKLINWSISFNPLYELTYQWTPSTDLSCADCPNPKAAPDTETEYELQITDSYGCIVRDSIIIKTDNDTIPITIHCIEEAQNSITFGWNPTSDVSYEVNVDNQGWIPASGVGAHTVSGLAEGQTVLLQVRGNGDCINQKGEVECMTSVCFPPDASIRRVLNQSCHENADGLIELDASDPNIIFILGSDTTTNNRFPDLKADQYSIIALDTTTTCFITLDTIISKPDSIILDTFKTVASCGMDDAIAAVTPSGGTEPYILLWNVDLATDTIKNQGPGTYTVELTDAFGCTAVQSITIESDDTPVPMSLPITCQDITPTSVSFSWNPNGDVPLYEVQIGDGEWSAPSANSSITISDLGIVETVQIKVRGSGDCVTILDSMSCTITDCLPPIGLVDAVFEGRCADYTDGVIALNSPMEHILFILEEDTSFTGVFEGLLPGDYEFTLLDTITKCSSTLSETLANREPLVVGKFEQSENCGEQDGIAAVTVTGGVAPYEIRWSNGKMGDTIKNLATETYYATITDEVGCQQEHVFLINLNIDNLEDLRINVQCPVVTNNSIIFTWDQIPNIVEYEINLNDEGWKTANGVLQHEIRDLGFSEIFNMQVRGKSDCGGYVVGNQICATTNCIPPTASITEPRNISCIGDSDGEIDLIVNTFPFSFIDTTFFVVIDSAGINVIDTTQYTLDTLVSPIGGFVILGTDTLEATAENPLVTFTNLPAGTYVFQLMDTTLSCRSTIDLTVGEPDTLKLLTNFEGPVTCPGLDDGVLVVSAIGGTGAHTYDWNEGAHDSDIFTGVSPGNYQVVATDANGCTVSESYVVEEPASIIQNVHQRNIGCGEVNSGEAGINIDPAFNYSLVWDNGSTADTLFNLEPGFYKGIVTTDNCTDSAEVRIEAVILELSTSAINPLCAVGDAETAASKGNAFVTATGNDPTAYSYQWNDPTGQTTDTAFALTPGDYIVRVTDNTTQCSKTDTVTISDPTPLEATLLNVGNETCHGTMDGSVVFDVSGGVSNYEIDWGDGFVRTETGRNNLSAGDYTLTITDDNGCSKNLDFTIGVPDSILLSFTSTTINCETPRGTATVTATGGSGNFSYQWNDVDGQTDSTAINLTEAEFQVIVMDETTGCSTFDQVNIIKEIPFEVTPSVTPSLCVGEATGTASVEVTGGSGNFRYLWDDPTAQETPTATNLASGDYMILVIDTVEGCEESLLVTVTDESTPMETSFTTQDISCGGESDGNAEVNIIGGTPGYQYEWSTGATTRSIENLAVGEYLLTVTDQNDCIILDTVNIIQPDSLVGTASGKDITCEGERDGFIEIALQGGSGNYEYSIDGNRYSSTSEFPELRANTYFVKARDDRGCELDLGEVKLEEPSAIGVTLQGQNIISAGNPSSLQPEIINGQGMISYAWTSDRDSTSLSCTDCDQPEISPGSGQTYFVTVTDEQGCSAETSFQVLVRQQRGVFVPTGFSPNADGTNDRLLVHGKEGTKVLSFRVFDRWGELVYEQYNFLANELESGWDGTYRGQAMNAAVFTWMAEVEYPDGLQELVKGHSTLVK